MNKKYQVVSYYTLIPLFIMPVLAAVEYISITNPQLRYQDIFITVVFLAAIYLSLRFDHCLITDKEFSRKSYFSFSIKKFKVADITEITFPPTWIVTPEASLAVWDSSGHKITMTDMAYTRPVLADVVRSLLKINPSIRLDEQARLLINHNDNP
jgi:hypothetical protein